MQDKLDVMLVKQKDLQTKLGYDFDKMSDLERAMYIKEYAQHLDHELHEVLAEIPFFKSWKKYPDDQELLDVCWEKAEEEFADVLHFLFNIALGLRLTSSDMLCLYLGKNEENYKRQEDLEQYKPCRV